MHAPDPTVIEAALTAATGWSLADEPHAITLLSCPGVVTVLAPTPGDLVVVYQQNGRWWTRHLTFTDRCNAAVNTATAHLADEDPDTAVAARAAASISGFPLTTTPPDPDILAALHTPRGILHLVITRHGTITARLDEAVR